VAGIGVEVVGAEAGLHQLGGGIAFPDVHWPEPNMPTAVGPFLQRALNFSAMMSKA
jgi:hypothetical protein